MVSRESVQIQLKQIGFNHITWGKSEVDELPNIILPEEVIYECVNGYYEAGFSLLVATNFRVLLIDKKPLSYLTVLDLRFDMINEIEYSHRLMGAQITISTGSKTLVFRSYNKLRLRKLIEHVQHRMAEAKHLQSKSAEGQNDHLELLNQQLQAYLSAQHQSQQQISRQLEQTQTSINQMPISPSIVEPSMELAEYLMSQTTEQIQPQTQLNINPNELLEEGMKEVFGRRSQNTNPTIY